MLLASLMAVAVWGSYRTRNVRRPINASKGSHRFTDSCGPAATIQLSRSGKVRASQYWSDDDQQLFRLRMGFGKSPESRPRHRFPSRDEWSRRRENHACRRRRSKTSMTAESSTSIIKTTSFPLQTSADESATRARQRRTPLSPHETTSKTVNS
jgi:hypothetical protein